MAEYKDWKTKKFVEIKNMKAFEFPTSGAKILLKARPPISKEYSTD